MHDRWRFPLVATALGILTVAVYAQAVRFGFIPLDDSGYIIANRYVRAGLTFEGLREAFTTFRGANWHPLTWLSHMLDVRLFGLWAGGHHLVNVLIHTVNAILLLLVLHRMTGALWKSAFVAAAFALHPLHVESVAWIAERKDLLSTFFLLLATGSYLGYARKRSRAGWAAVTAFFALGLLSKPMIATAPFLFLLLDYWPLNRFSASAEPGAGDTEGGRSTLARLTAEKGAWFAMAAASSVVTFIAQSSKDAIPSLEILPLGARLGNAVCSYAVYLWKTLFPFPLAVFYPLPPTEPAAWLIALSLFLLVALSLAATLGRRRFPFLFVGWFWFVGMLVPVIGIVQVGGQAMADRYMYFPVVGLFLCMAWGAESFARDRISSTRLGAIAAILVAAMSIATFRQLGYWRNGIELFRHTMDVTAAYPHPLVRWNLGKALFEAQRFPEAMAQFREADRLSPGDPEYLLDMGLAAAAMGQAGEAETSFRAAIRQYPEYVPAYCLLGKLLEDTGKPDEGLGLLKDAVRIAPENPEARLLLGQMLARRSDFAGAADQLRASADISEVDPVAFFNYGIVLHQLGRYAEAAESHRRAVSLQPSHNEARINLAIDLTLMGKAKDAVPIIREAVRRDPANRSALNDLGKILAQAGMKDEAADAFRRAAAP